MDDSSEANKQVHSEPESSRVPISASGAKRVSQMGPVKALLTPSAELLGDLAKETLQDWLKDRSAKNIKEHSAKVLRGAEQDDLSEQRQLDLFAWAEKAGRVSPEEMELSASVRAALRATLDGDQEDAEILMRLTKSEILFLLDPEDRIRNPNRAHALRTLEQKALIQKGRDNLYGTQMYEINADRSRSFIKFGAEALPVLLVIVFAYMLLLSGNPIQLEINILKYSIYALLSVTAGIATARIIGRDTNSFFLTSKGMEISSKLRVFMSEMRK